MNLLYKIEKKEEIKDNKDDEKDALLKKSKIKFNADYEVYDEIFALQDGRILTIQSYEINNEKKYKACIYNIDYDFVICDICIDIDSGYIIQMEDNNIINELKDEIKVIKIKKYTMEEIQSIKASFYNIYKLSNNKILIYHLHEYMIYLFQNGKLVFDKKITIGNNIYVYNVLEINEDEIVIYCNKRGLIGDTIFLLSYAIKNNNEKKSLKLGNSSSSTTDIRLINQNHFIIAFDSKIFVIDIKNRKIIHEHITKSTHINLLVLIDKRYILVNNLFCGYTLYEIDNSGKIHISFHTIVWRYNEYFKGIYTKNLIFLQKDKKVKIKNIFKLC